MRVLGFMTGTSLDAVDAAVLETDGERILDFGPVLERKLSEETRALVQSATRNALAWGWDEPPPASFASAARAIEAEHFATAEALLTANGLNLIEIDLVGFHGQTVLHQPAGAERAVGRTVQLGDGARLAQALGLPVAWDFRSADVAAGGQGAPLAPAYHRALVSWSGLERPVAVLNLGGVGNVTLVKADGSMEAFDTGPANGMIDLLVQARGVGRCDEDGMLAQAGQVREAVVEAYLAAPYFSRGGPKSLDRFDFSLEPVDSLSLEDAAATLTDFAARAVGLALKRASERPTRLIVCGGGRHNPALMSAIEACAGVPVRTAEAVGWRGDSIEAEAFAFLAARTKLGLPISWPDTTGVPKPMTGGQLADP